jgi:transposase-like protein
LPRRRSCAGFDGYAPESIKRWNRFGRCTGRSWRVDETYLKVGGEWTYLYRALDKSGLSRTRDVAAAKAFFKKAIRYDGRPPHTITLDGYAASHRAAREMREDGPLPWRTKLRSSRHVNNLIEQDHRGIKSRTRPMLGFKNFESAVITVSGIELLRRIHKGQFTLDRLRFNGQAAPVIRMRYLLHRNQANRSIASISPTLAICTRVRLPALPSN